MKLEQQQPPQQQIYDNGVEEHSLYCEEEKWEDEQQQVENISLFPLHNLLEHDLFWENEELVSLFAKEREQHQRFRVEENHFCRQEAVDWILRVNAYYGFSIFTSILAINYLDRFITNTCYKKDDKPWIVQLVAVTCLSLAAKVEEIHVPLLLDLQVVDSRFVFEAKTIQRMELLVLSTLQWKMHPVTPLSFLHHIIRRLGLKTQLHWEFMSRCETLLLTLVSDPRSGSYLPSVLATATMMYVIDQVEHFNPIDYQNQLLGVLKISKERVRACYELIVELSKSKMANRKRKFEAMPTTPNGVIDSVFSCESSNESNWVLGASIVSSSPQQPLFKKATTQDHLVFVDIIANSPR